MQPLYSVYLHIPFCTHRCAYCDFNTYAGHERLISAYVSALCSEIRFVASSAPERLPVHTIFFGGGTPSLLSPAQFDNILQTIRDYFIFSPKLEISLEANPGTVTLETLRGLKWVGFNRISYGVQSFHPDELRQLERIHDPFDVFEAVRWARRAGFENINLDLIYGLPEQAVVRWQTSLRQAVALSPEHLSLYALTIEPGTPFGHWAARGLMANPDPDLAADMYELASGYLAEQGYEQYEISNWAKPGFQCRHNLQYWRNKPYLGFGAGAHGCADGLRTANILRIKSYIKKIDLDPIPHFPKFPDSLILDRIFPQSPATVTQTKLTPFIEMQETLMLGLRLTQEGVSLQEFTLRFGVDLMAVFKKEIDGLVKLGLLEWVSFPPLFGEGLGIREKIRLTPRGRLLGNQVFMQFVD